MQRVALIGLGLMGASLGLGLKRGGFGGQVVAYARRPETRQAALQQGVVDAVFEDPAGAAAEADLLIFCTPIRTIPELVEAVKPALKPGALLTDVGSTKSWLADAVEAVLEDVPATFVGSHPVAGSEQQGLEAARPDLYEGALVVVTPGAVGAPESVEAVAAFWRQLGSHVTVLPAAEHDRLMARTSHLPHLTASLLAVTVGRDDAEAETGPYCGTGFRDTSRVAAGSPEVWHDIVSTNAPAIEAELKAYQAQLAALLAQLAAGDFEAIKGLLAAGCERRQALLAASPVNGSRHGEQA
jgi:prephenate dehydrogenase